ncbi:MAG: hypothetical protein WB994_10490 [Candidatus Acidiferrum sp.]
MLFSLAMEAGCGPAEGGVAGFWPTREERCLRHRELDWTRHPMLGAAERRAALLVNVLTRRELANCERWRLNSGALR